MSKNYYHIEYECHCLMDPWGGECDSKSHFIVRQNCSTDSNTIFHKCHGHEWHVYNPGEYINDHEIGALQDVLNLRENKTPIPDSFWEYLRNEV